MADRLRIAHLTPVYPPYAAGAGVACAYQAGELARRGHDVEVFTVAGSAPPPPTPATVHALPAILQLGAAPVLPGLARLPDVDVVHVHHPFIFGVEPALAHVLRRRGTALVVSYHNRLVGDGLRRPLFFGYEETLGRALAARADRLCVLSEAHASTISYLRTATERSPWRLALVPNGVDTERFSPGRAPHVRREAGIPDDAIVVVHVATLDRTHYLKRTDVALKAVQHVDDPRVHLLVVGDGERRAQFEASAAARRLGDRVHFLGERDHDGLPDALRAGDLFLLSSDLDAFPLVLLEALSCGLPAVATDPPGVRAMVQGSEAALLAPAGDIEALAARVAELAGASPEERARRGASARALVEERYALPRIVDRLETVYDEALRARALSRRRVPPMPRRERRRERVAISLATLAPGRVGGSERYVRELLAALAADADGTEVLVIAPTVARRAHAGLLGGPGLRVVAAPMPAPARAAGRAAALAASLVAARTLARRLPEVDVIHHPLTVPALQPPAPAVITIHDVAHLALPHHFSEVVRAFRRVAYDGPAQRAAGVIAPSEHARDAIVEHLGVAPERVRVIRHGVDHERFAGARPESRRLDALRLPERFVLYPANLWPHKNHERLVRALAAVEDRSLGLVLTGQDFGRAGALADVARGAGVADRVRHLGYLSDDLLASLYRRARALVFPSLYEGFAFPLVEAMASGLPVAAADRTSLPEVAGDAALLFDPEDEGAIAAAIDRLTGDDALRERLASAGPQRASIFSWKASARAHLEVYRGVSSPH